MANNAIKGVLFDLDGVLIDSEGIYTQFWDAVDKRYPTGVPGFSQVIKGSNLHKILHTYFPTQQLRDEVTAMLDNFQKDMRYDYFAGTIDLLKKLNEQEILCCIVTSSDRNKMNALYNQKPEFPGFFKAIVTGEMVANPKPDPECYILGAKMLGLNIKDCCVVEDSINGLEAGMASGAMVIGIPSTCTRDAIKSHCHIIVDDLSQIENHILNQE